MKELEKLAVKIPVKLPSIEEMPIHIQQMLFGEVIYHVSEDGIRILDPNKIFILDPNTTHYER